MKKFGKLFLSAFVCVAFGAVALAGPTLLNQPPDQENGGFADSGCDICGTLEQSICIPFAADSVVGSLIIWGGYFPNDTPGVDSFTVRILEDPGGDGPDGPISNEVRGGSRALTGVSLFGVSEYQININITDVAVPGPALYWLEIFNATGLGTDDFFWETSSFNNPDVGGSFSGFAFETPGVTWMIGGGTGAPGETNAVVIREADELSVTMESFTGELAEDGAVNLEWATASEADNVGFEVVRVMYGREKATRSVSLGFVPAMGNTLEGASYEFTEITPPAGRVHYIIFDIDSNNRRTQHGPVVIETRVPTSMQNLRFAKPTTRTKR